MDTMIYALSNSYKSNVAQSSTVLCSVVDCSKLVKIVSISQRQGCNNFSHIAKVHQSMVIGREEPATILVGPTVVISKHLPIGSGLFLLYEHAQW